MCSRQVAFEYLYSNAEREQLYDTTPVGGLWPAFLPMHTPEKRPAIIEPKLPASSQLDSEGSKDLPKGHPSIGLAGAGFKCPFAKKKESVDTKHT